MELYNKTENELNAPTTNVSGNIYIGGGESYVMGLISSLATAKKYFNSLNSIITSLINYNVCKI